MRPFSISRAVQAALAFNGLFQGPGPQEPAAREEWEFGSVMRWSPGPPGERTGSHP